MSRVNVRITWVLLLLLPSLAAAQSDPVDRSRARRENRTVESDRSVKRAQEVSDRKVTRAERPNLGGDESRDLPKVKRAQRNAETARTSRRHQTRVETRGQRTDSRTVRRPEPDRRSDHREVKHRSDRRDDRGPDKNVRHRDRRGDSKHRAPRGDDYEHRSPRHGNVKHRGPVRHRGDVRHRGNVKHRGSNHGHVKHRHHNKPPRRFVYKRKHHTYFGHHRHPVKRYVYRHRHYHRHHSRRVSLGFYIRIPTARWHVGHTRRFAYRHFVTGHPAGDVEIESTFKRRIRHVRHDYVEVEFELDRIAVSSAGQYLGDADAFPGGLRTIRAKIYRDGFVQFERMLYVVGNEYDGFELLSMRHCGDPVRASIDCLRPRAGEIDFYDRRVHGTRYSRLLELSRHGRAVPVALVPDEEYLGFQYVMGYGSSRDGYYSGSYDYSSLSRYDEHGTAYRLSADEYRHDFSAASGAWSDGLSGASFAHSSVVSYPRGDGATLELQHQSEVRYIDD